MKRLMQFVTTAGIVLAAGCSGNPVDPGQTPFPIPNPALVAETASVEGLSLDLECYLWRDFMPGPYPSGSKGMMAGIRVFETRLKDLPAKLAPEYMWVFNKEGEVWGVRIDRGIVTPTKPWEILTVARDGPAWDTGMEVEVVVRLAIGRRSIYIRESGVIIERTE